MALRCPKCKSVLEISGPVPTDSVQCLACGAKIKIAPKVEPKQAIQNSEPEPEEETEKPYLPLRRSRRDLVEDDEPPVRYRDRDSTRQQINVVVNERQAYSHSLGITSIILGVVSLPIICMPCVGWVGVGIGSIGFICGAFALFQSINRKGHGIGFAIGGLTLCFFSAVVSGIVLLFFATMFQGMRNAVKEAEKKQAEEKKAEISAEQDAPTVGGSTTLGGVKVVLISAKVGSVRVKSIFDRTWHNYPEESLILTVRVENVSPNKLIKYSTWRKQEIFGDKATKLTDEHGNAYFLQAADDDVENGVHIIEELNPGKAVNDVIPFRVPIDQAKKFTLRLNGERVGQKGFIYFRFSRDEIEWKK